MVVVVFVACGLNTAALASRGASVPARTSRALREIGELLQR